MCGTASRAGCNCGIWIYIESHNYRGSSAHRYSEEKKYILKRMGVKNVCE